MIPEDVVLTEEEISAERLVMAQSWCVFAPLAGSTLLDELTDPRLPAVALHVYGSANEVWTKMGALAEAAKINRAWPWPRTMKKGSGRDEIHEHLNALYREMAGRHAGLECAERAIEVCGWRWNESERRMEQMSHGRLRGRPAHYLNRCIVAAFEEISPESRPANDSEVREKIRATLLWYFPPECLGTQRNGPIWSAIKNHLDLNQFRNHR